MSVVFIALFDLAGKASEKYSKNEQVTHPPALIDLVRAVGSPRPLPHPLPAVTGIIQLFVSIATGSKLATFKLCRGSVDSSSGKNIA